MIQNSVFTEPRAFGKALGDILRKLSRYFALGGGIVLCSIVVISSLSIAGRILFDSPLTGDFELTEMGCAMAIFMFMPWCQLNRGNVIVDFFTLRLSEKYRLMLDAFTSFIFAGVVALFTYRMVFGGLDMFNYQDQTMLLQIPIWIPFIPAVLSFLLLFIVCLYTAYLNIQNSLTIR